MYCRYCGKKIEDEESGCSTCAKKYTGSSKKSVKRFKIILLIFLLLISTSIIIVGIVGLLQRKEDTTVQKLQTIEAACLDGNYDKASDIVDTIPVKYQQYFGEYINYAEKLDSWSGTRSELIEYLDIFFESIGGEEYIALLEEDTLLLDYSLDLWGDIDEAHGKFKEAKYELESMIVWEPELRDIQTECFTEYFSILYDIRDMLYCPPNQEKVEISILIINEFDARIEQWYFNYLTKLDDIRNKYSSETFNEYINSFNEDLAICYEAYENDFSLRNRYAVSNNLDVLYIHAENANNGYEHTDTLITLTIQEVLQDTMLNNLYKNNFAIVSEETKEYFYSHCDAAQNLLDIINDVFPNVMPEIYDGKGPTIFDAVEDSINKVVEVRK